MTGIEIAILVLAAYPVLNSFLNEIWYNRTVQNGSPIEYDRSMMPIRYFREIHTILNEIEQKLKQRSEPSPSPNIIEDRIVPLDAIESAAMFSFR